MEQRSPPPHPPALEAIAARAAARALACPYCQDALQVRWIAPDALQLVCPTCGFSELPDAARVPDVMPAPGR